MSKIITKTADELLEMEESVIADLQYSSSVFVVIHPTDDKEDLNIVKDLGSALNYDGEIFAYEEPGGKGGGGCELLPSLSEVIFCSVAFVVTTSAAAFVNELTKDIYKSTLQKLFNKKKNSPYEDGKFVMKLSTPGGVCITYYFQRFLTDIEFVEAMILIKDHYWEIEKNEEKIEYYDFIYDRKDNIWLPL